MNACPRCATVLLPGASVCSACGLLLNAAPVAPPPPPAPAAPAPPPAAVAPAPPPPAAFPPPPPPMPVALPPEPLPQGAPYGGLTTPLPETAEPASAAKPKRESLPRRTVILLLVLVVVVIGGAAYYEIHKSSNNTNTPVPAAGSETLPPPGSSQSTAPSAPTLTRGEAAAQSDLRNLATVEETYLTDFNRYTTSSTALDKEGYRKFHTAGVVSYAGVHGNKDYCLVSSARGKAPFYLYDSASRGLQSASFPTAKSAENACTDHSIKSYAHIT